VPVVRTPTELTDAFRHQGLKITPQRVAIFQVLHDNPSHPSADAVYEAVAADLPSISLRTVYQTLNDLAGMGEIQSLDLGTGAARFDPNVADHHHLVCDQCGVVTDVHADVAGVHPSPLAGFVVHATNVIFRGRCATCEAAGPTNPTNQRNGDNRHG
jgi:Fe2+ or Zn2+ uptake regulation protein